MRIDNLFSPSDFFDKALWHIRRPQPAPVLPGQGQYGRRLEEAIFKHVKGIWSLLFDLWSDRFEPGLGLFLRSSLQDLVQHLVHSVTVVGRGLVENVSTEVYTEGFLGLTPLPGQTGERFPECLNESRMGVARSQLNARETTPLETANEPAPAPPPSRQRRSQGPRSPAGPPH